MERLSEVVPDPGDLTMAQAAGAARVHPKTIRRWVVEGLPAYRWGKGGRIMIRPDDLARFIDRHRQL
jgi:predicted site-specific integrase-resolvase